MLRNNSKTVRGIIHVVNISVEKKEGLQWQGFADKEGFKPGKKE